MSNQERPNGWTDRMQPLNTDIAPGVRDEAPEFGGATGKRMASPQGGGDGAPASTPPSGQGGAQGQGEGQQGREMTAGEKYWYEQCMEARNQYKQVAPLAPYVDVISYLDANPDAVELVTRHMKETIDSNNGYLPDPNAGDNTGVHQNQRVAAPMHSNQQNQRGNLDRSNSQFVDQVRDANMDFLKKNGIPEHEADQYIQFLINPGELEPQQLFNMYRVAKGQAPITENPNQPTNNTQQPKANNQQPPREQGSPAGNMPPMSVASMNGGTVDPREETTPRNEPRQVLDPNNL